MHDFINTYVYLLIAMISFIAPIMLFLLSIFSHGIVLVKKRADEERRQIKTLLALKLSESDVADTFIENSNKRLKENEKINKKKLNLLNPKWQIIRTFGLLFISLALIMGDMLVREKPWHLYNHWVSAGLIIASFVFLGLSMLVLLQVGWEIIDTKILLEEEKNAVALQADTKIVRQKRKPKITGFNVNEDGTQEINS